jgi:hypothetical protein
MGRNQKNLVNRYMEKEVVEHLPHIALQLKKREKWIQIFYKTGRPIFNSIQDKKHIFYKSDVDNCKRGFYL